MHTTHRRYCWPQVFELEQTDVRTVEWVASRLDTRGARHVDWRRAITPGWRRELFVHAGRLWVAGEVVPAQTWVEVPLGDDPVVSTHHSTVFSVVHRGFERLRLPGLGAAADDGLSTLVHELAGTAPHATRDEAALVGAALTSLTQRLEEAPAGVELAQALGRDERRASEALIEYFTHYHATVSNWRHYLRALRLELAVSAFSAGRGTTEVARWLGFRNPTALLHSFQKERLPSPGLLREVEADDPQGAVQLCQQLSHLGRKKSNRLRAVRRA